jgi:superfamily I DNA/RNA helicase
VPIRPEQVAAAEITQHDAANAVEPTVRLVAPPGTGKSRTIEERVRWLLADRGVSAEEINVVSFTRASSADLRRRVHKYCSDHGLETASNVRVATLHSLALSVLRRAGLLTFYPASPMVLDAWEQKHVFDAEFAVDSARTPGRCEDIRRDHEAFWSTGTHDPANFIPPDPPVTAAERTGFRTFHGPRTQTYSCVLPGEIVRKCVQHMTAGLIDVAEHVRASHLIVDEVQDLNPCDLEFVELLIGNGVTTFIAGDDDQSIYSFRFAAPSGIQEFVTQHPGSGDKYLTACFRCTPAILESATTLMDGHAMPGRIPKVVHSLYEEADPPLRGQMVLRRFDDWRTEAQAIAETCRRLIDAGVAPGEVLILISNRRRLARTITVALGEADVPYEGPSSELYKDTKGGRLAVALLRIVCNEDDYVAHRILLGLQHGVGAGTCNSIARRVVDAALDYRELFRSDLPADVFSNRETRAIAGARALLARVDGWSSDDSLSDRLDVLSDVVAEIAGEDERDLLRAELSPLPDAAHLVEARDLLWADTAEQEAEVALAAHARTETEPPEFVRRPPSVRIMTMHVAKGLSAEVVIIPGLEEEIFPGDRRRPYPGLVLEAARLLYMSITRARAACIVTLSRHRAEFGQYVGHTPSRFAAHLGGPFTRVTGPLSDEEVAAIAETCGLL